MKNKKVIISCERIKTPNTGLYTFCKELIKGVENNKGKYSIKTSYLTSKRCHIPGIEVRNLTLWDRICFLFKRNDGILHLTWQLDYFIPRNKGNRKVLLTIHDLNYRYEKSSRKALAYDKKVQQRVDIADHIVTISNYAKQDILSHLDVKDKPIDVIYNGCCFFEGNKIESPIYKPEREYIFSIGTILRKKNFHVLPALLTNNDLELIIAGNPSPYSEIILSEAKKFGVQDRVKLLGAISDAEKDWYYRNCKAFAFPSIAEGFGLPVIEALHYGKPTFISRHTSLPEVGREHCFYFDYDFNPIKMRKELDEGLEQFEQRDVNLQIEYAHSFSWQNATDQYCKIYSSLLGQ